jgi:hypothetical protein
MVCAIGRTPIQNKDDLPFEFRTKADTVPHAFQETLLIG